MSADNSICVLVSRSRSGRPEYRVSHVKAVENASCDYDPARRDRYLRDEFAKCEVFPSAQSAFMEARRLLAKHEYVEYGIVEVKTGRPFPALADDVPVKRRPRRASRLQREVRSLRRRVAELERLVASR
jgi:hypothetical protein